MSLLGARFDDPTFRATIHMVCAGTTPDDRQRIADRWLAAGVISEEIYSYSSTSTWIDLVYEVVTASLASVEWVTESRFRYEPLDEPAPEDWRFIRHEFHNESGLRPEHPWWALYTHAVEGDPIRVREWVKLRQVRQERRVTPWADVLASGEPEVRRG